MGINEELETYIKAFRVTESTILPQLLERVQSKIEKLEQDVKVLRWALYQARDALSGQTVKETTAMSLLDTARRITEPTNDR